METITFKYLLSFLPFIGISVLGQLTNILAKLSKLEKVSDFSLKIWLKENKFGTIFGLVASIGIIYWLNSEDVLTTGTALMAGYAADSLIKSVSSKYEKSKK